MNKPSEPFITPHHVDLHINFDEEADDRRRTLAEDWCCYRTVHRWFRRVFTELGIVRFEFDDKDEAATFKLFHSTPRP